MEITIKAEPKEIVQLISELQEPTNDKVMKLEIDGTAIREALCDLNKNYVQKARREDACFNY